MFNHQNSRTPTVLQMESVECSAACLTMILAYYGKWLPLEDVRVSCGVSRDGASAGQLMRAARGYGLEVHAFKSSPNDLAKLGLPAVAFWEFNHFVVLERIDERSATINDPAIGRRELSRAEFDRGYTGVILTLKPGDSFESSGSRPSVRSQLLQRAKRVRSGLTLMILAGLLLVIPTLAMAELLRQFVNSILIDGDRSQLTWIFSALVLAGTSVVYAGYLRDRLVVRLRRLLTVETSAAMVGRLIRLPMVFYSQRSAGDLAYRASLNSKVAALASGKLAAAILGTITGVFYLVMMFVYSWQLSVVAVVTAALNVVLLVWSQRLRKEQSVAVQRQSALFSAEIQSNVASIDTVKVSGTEDNAFRLVSSRLAQMAANEQEAAVTSLRLSLGPKLLTTLSAIVTLVVGAYLVIQGDLSIGTLVAFNTLVAGFVGPIGTLVSMGAALQQINGDLVRIDDIMKAPMDARFEGLAYTAAQSGTNGIGLAIPDRTCLRFENVTFGYDPNSEPLISNLSFEISPSRRVAFVGSSGAGKSTIAKLASGSLHPWTGEITVDGRPLSDYAPEVMATYVSYVAQETRLFPGTVRDNLTLWDDTVSTQRLTRACREVDIADTILTRPGGFDAEVAEGGRNFSGGQCQRIQIARALIQDPSLLILDEATSALDEVTELRIDRELQRRGCAQLVIAHRLSTIRDADEIVVLNRGQVAQRGKHEDLVAQGGEYGRLVAS